MSGPRGAGEPRLILSANLTRMVAGGALLSAAVRGVDYLLLPQNSEFDHVGTPDNDVGHH